MTTDKAGREIWAHPGPHAQAELRVRLDDGQTLVLPQSVARLLSHALTEMTLGNAVTPLGRPAGTGRHIAGCASTTSKPTRIGWMRIAPTPWTI